LESWKIRGLHTFEYWPLDTSGE